MKATWLQPACASDGEESTGSGSKTSKTSKSPLKRLFPPLIAGHEI